MGAIFEAQARLVNAHSRILTEGDINPAVSEVLVARLGSNLQGLFFTSTTSTPPGILGLLMGGTE